MTEPASVTLKRGSLYLSRAIYERFLAGIETVILLRRADDLLILPVHQAASGGYLLKLRNGGRPRGPGGRLLSGARHRRRDRSHPSRGLEYAACRSLLEHCVSTAKIVCS
jgi:hypothetical protein